MPRTTIRYERERNGWRYTIRDAKRKRIASGWVAGDINEARDEARDVRDRATRAREVA